MRKNQCIEALATTAGCEVALPEAFGVELGFGMLLAGFIDGRIGQAQHDAPDDAQDESGIGGAHAAEVFLHTHVQAVVQSALNDPVLAFELE